MSGVLRAQLTPDQMVFLQEVFTPYDRYGEWPVWAYVDHVLDAQGLVGRVTEVGVRSARIRTGPAPQQCAERVRPVQRAVRPPADVI